MKLSGHTKTYAVLGHPIGHTLSPIMHNAAFAALDMDAVYLAFDVLPENVMSVLGGMEQMGFGGCNLTVPHKEVAFRGLTNLDESAQLMGSVNTVHFSDSGPVGYNTDGYGFLRAVEEAFGASPKGKKVFVLGTGGAGRAVALMCARAGAASVALSDLDVERTERVATEVRRAFGAVETSVVPVADAVASAAESDLVVHATPVGMKEGEKGLLPREAFHPGQWVFDLIYHIPVTPFMAPAMERDASAANGLDMLLYQGARAFEIWTGQTPPDDIMRAALQKVVYGS